MSELDEKRKNNLLKNMKDMQIIITCTEKIKYDELKMKEFKVEEGKVFEINA